MITLFYSPHAQSTDNLAGRASGHADVPLTEDGRRIAKELGLYYATERIDMVLCSDLERAYRTAELAFADRGVPIVRDERLRECDYGELTQFPVGRIDEEFIRHIDDPFPGGQSVRMVTNNVAEVLSSLLDEADGKAVVIIGHRATKYAIEYWTGDESLEDLVRTPGEWLEIPIWRYKLKVENLQRQFT